MRDMQLEWCRGRGRGTLSNRERGGEVVGEGKGSKRRDSSYNLGGWRGGEGEERESKRAREGEGVEEREGEGGQEKGRGWRAITNAGVIARGEAGEGGGEGEGVAKEEGERRDRVRETKRRKGKSIIGRGQMDSYALISNTYRCLHHTKSDTVNA